MQLAFSNAQALASLQTKRQRILDCSIYGMGRGAGNLPTELAARYLNQTVETRYQVGEVLDLYDEYIAPLRREYEWGYSTGLSYRGVPVLPSQLRRLFDEQADLDHAGH